MIQHLTKCVQESNYNEGVEESSGGGSSTEEEWSCETTHVA